MKNLFFLLFAMIAFCSHAQMSTGSYAYFPNAKLAGLSYRPQMAFTIKEAKPYLTVFVCAGNTYFEYDKDSRMLLKFEDGTTKKLNIICTDDENPVVDKFYENMYAGGVIVNLYQTYALFEVDDETIERMTKTDLVTKIRLVFTNGNAKDYDMTPKYMPKFREKMLESLKNAQAGIEKKQAIMNDEDF